MLGGRANVVPGTPLQRPSSQAWDYFPLGDRPRVSYSLGCELRMPFARHVASVAARDRLSTPGGEKAARNPRPGYCVATRWSRRAHGAENALGERRRWPHRGRMDTVKIHISIPRELWEAMTIIAGVRKRKRKPWDSLSGLLAHAARKHLRASESITALRAAGTSRADALADYFANV